MTHGETPNILYYDGTSDSLRMMSKPGIGSWKRWTSIWILEPEYISAAAGPDGRVCTTYYDQGTGSTRTVGPSVRPNKGFRETQRIRRCVTVPPREAGLYVLCLELPAGRQPAIDADRASRMNTW